MKNMRTMVDVWRYLDNKYGRDDKLAAERITHLHSFQVSKSAHTTTANFKELHVCWREVYNDLDKVKAAGTLDNHHALNIFASKFPESCRDRYVDLKNQSSLKDKKASKAYPYICIFCMWAGTGLTWLLGMNWARGSTVASFLGRAESGCTWLL